MVTKTLDAMAAGGMYDLLGGGFHRYSVDDRWLVPHFEKMLYDNALLAPVYLHAWLVTGNERYREVVEETVDYMLRELALPEGGFASAQDADTDGVEGLTFTWTEEEGVPAELLEPFEHGRSILRGELDEELRARLFELREQRPKPLRDDKAIASWNGLALAALAEAGWRLERPDWIEAARALGEFLLGPLSDETGGSCGATATAVRAARASSTTTRTSPTGCSSCTSRPASRAGSRRRTGSRGSRSSSSATRSTAASSSRRRAASGWSRGRRSSTTTRSRPATRCSRTCCCGSSRIYGDDELERLGVSVPARSAGARASARRRSAGRSAALDLHLSPPRELAIVGAGRLGGRPGGARAVAAEHRRRGRPGRRRAAARGQGRSSTESRRSTSASDSPATRRSPIRRSCKGISQVPTFPARSLSKW